jgi:ELWxxDGT repeat protein
VEWRGSTFFSARDAPSTTRELWKTDGSEAGTVRLKDVLGVPTASDPLNLSPYRGMLFYGVSDLDHGIELWATDGTGPGPGMLGDIWEGAGSGLPTAGHGQPAGIIFGLGDRVYFVGSDGRSGEELWSYRVPAP